MVKKWWKEAVIYQIYPRSFMDSNGDGIGDLKGITGRLDYLKYLGIDVIWLSPVYQSPNDDNGYDISDYQAIMDEFGTMEDFDEMLAEAHKRNIRIVMDLVVNHTSDEHRWFVESRKSKENPYRDYYIWREGKEDGTAPNNWGACFGGSAWEYDEETKMYYLHMFSKKQPDLNWDNPKVRREVFDMMTWWCEKGIDGFRMDVISMISKTKEMPDGEVQGFYGNANPYCVNGPKVHDYLQEMNEKVLSKYDIMTVGETAGVTTELAKQYAGEDTRELNMVFQFEHVESDGKYGKWTDEKVPLPVLKKIMSRWQTELYEKAWNSLFWDNHDQPRAVSRFGDDRPEYREVSAKMLATCLHMMQGTPYIYQGEELGMTNAGFTHISQYRDVESLNHFRILQEKGLTEGDAYRILQVHSRDNGRTPMQWEAGENGGFTDSAPWLEVNGNCKEINAAQQMEDKDSIFHYYRELVRLRKEYDVISYGSFQALDEGNPSVLAYMREYEGQKLAVICNFYEKERDWKSPVSLQGFQRLLGNYERCEVKEEMRLRPYEALILYERG